MKTRSLKINPNLLFIKNPDHNIRSIEQYLTRRDFVFNSASTLNDAIEKIDILKPSYVFVPWNHTDPNVREHFSFATGTDYIIIPYVYSQKTQDIKNLMRLNFPLKLFPPVAGTTIQRLILKYAKDLENKNKPVEVNKIKSSIYQNDNNKIMRIEKGLGTFDLQNEEIQIATLGQINRQKQSAFLKNLNRHKTISTDKNSDKIFEFDSITDMTSKNMTAHFNKKINMRLSAKQKNNISEKFEQKIQTELTEILNQTDSISTSGPVNYCLLIRSLTASGFIWLHSQSELFIDDIESVMQSWADELCESDETNSANESAFQSDIFEIENFDQLNLFNIITEKAAVYKNVSVNNKETILSYFDLNNNPFMMGPSNHPEYFSVDYNCFYNNSISRFDLFIEMAENKKIIKLFKNGTHFQDKEIKSILDKKEIPFLIDLADELNWFQYSVTSFIKSLDQIIITQPQT